MLLLSAAMNKPELRLHTLPAGREQAMAKRPRHTSAAHLTHPADLLDQKPLLFEIGRFSRLRARSGLYGGRVGRARPS